VEGDGPACGNTTLFGRASVNQEPARASQETARGSQDAAKATSQTSTLNSTSLISLPKVTRCPRQRPADDALCSNWWGGGTVLSNQQPAEATQGSQEAARDSQEAARGSSRKSY
jgi:hypothetical protein